jgi:hypothetical protein
MTDEKKPDEISDEQLENIAGGIAQETSSNETSTSSGSGDSGTSGSGTSNDSKTGTGSGKKLSPDPEKNWN